MASEPIHIGFMGGGPRGNSIYETLVFQRRFKGQIHPTCIVDRSPGVLKEWSYKVDFPCKSLDEMLRNESIDAVVIVTPPSTHAKCAKACLEAGVHAWSEVPMGLSLEELWAIRDAARANKGTGGTYALGENYCWHLGNQFALQLVNDGAMGDIFYMEGVYHHSLEHYMIVENFTHGKQVDPAKDLGTTPTWRATLPPITYGHAIGPCLHVLEAQRTDRPVQVSAFGNMKMLARFNTQNFQLGLCRTANDVICKFGSGFVLPNHGFTRHAFWGTRCLFEAPATHDGRYYLYKVPPDQSTYPARHQQEGIYLDDGDLREMGIVHATGGHGGSDTLMFQAWIDGIRGKDPYPIDAVKGAEMTACGICGALSIDSGRTINIPDFS